VIRLKPIEGTQMQRPKAHYPIEQVKALVRNGKWRVNSNALDSARNDFGWELEDIESAILALRPSHYTKTEPSKFKPAIMVDYYKAYNLKKENIYTHFYIDNDEVWVVINSFKRI
jgi:hypothetical protein